MDDELQVIAERGNMMMQEGNIFVFYGEGRGKTTLAVGHGIRMVGEERRVIMIQFLDYNNTKETIPLKKLEPDFKVFRFEKKRTSILDLDDAGRKELESEIKTAFQFSKKILETGECDLLLLDGILDAVEAGFVTSAELIGSLEKRSSYMNVILTGVCLPDDLRQKSSYIYKITTEKTPE